MIALLFRKGYLKWLDLVKILQLDITFGSNKSGLTALLDITFGSNKSGLTASNE